jgi:hypothetical protein
VGSFGHNRSNPSVTCCDLSVFLYQSKVYPIDFSKTRGPFYEVLNLNRLDYGSCFMVTWTIFDYHLLEVALTQNRENMAFRMLITVGLFNLIMCEDPHE